MHRGRIINRSANYGPALDDGHDDILKYRERSTRSSRGDSRRSSRVYEDMDSDSIMKEGEDLDPEMKRLFLDLKAPKYLFDPIHHQVMEDPVALSTGHIFDRSSVVDREGMLKYKRCPISGERLDPTMIPLPSIREETMQYLERRERTVHQIANKMFSKYQSFQLILEAVEKYLDGAQDMYLPLVRELASMWVVRGNQRMNGRSSRRNYNMREEHHHDSYIYGSKRRNDLPSIRHRHSEQEAVPYLPEDMIPALRGKYRFIDDTYANTKKGEGDDVKSVSFSRQRSLSVESAKTLNSLGSYTSRKSDVFPGRERLRRGSKKETQRIMDEEESLRDLLDSAVDERSVKSMSSNSKKKYSKLDGSHRPSLARYVSDDKSPFLYNSKVKDGSIITRAAGIEKHVYDSCVNLENQIDSILNGEEVEERDVGSSSRRRPSTIPIGGSIKQRPVVFLVDHLQQTMKGGHNMTLVRSGPVYGSIRSILVSAEMFHGSQHARSKILLSLYNERNQLVARKEIFQSSRDHQRLKFFHEVEKDEKIVSMAKPGYCYQLECEVAKGYEEKVSIRGLICKIIPTTLSMPTIKMKDPEGEGGKYMGSLDINGHAHGKGVFDYESGCTFVGEFQKGKFVRGVYYRGTEVRGTMKNGKWDEAIVDDGLVKEFPYRIRLFEREEKKPIKLDCDVVTMPEADVREKYPFLCCGGSC